MRSRLILVASVFAAVASSCGGNRFSTSTGSGGAPGSGGDEPLASGSGGDTLAASGGGDGRGGTTSSGGTTMDAGTSASGGAGGAGTGGVSASGGSGGDTTSSGGTASTGGAVSAGGTRPATGGTTATGGAPATGGTGAGGRGTGGTTSSGGIGGSGVGGTGGTPRWCDGQNVLFCEDFDRFATIDDFVNAWTNVSTTGAAFSFDSSAGVPSMPHALRVRTTQSSGVQSLAVQKLPAFASRPSKIRLEFDLQIDAADSVDLVSGAAFAGILTGSHVTDGIIGVEAGPGPGMLAGYIASDGTDAESAFSTAWPAENRWLGRFALEITYVSTATGVRTGCLQVYVAGVKQLPTCLRLNPLLVDPPLVSVALGIYSGGLGTTGDIALRFDDVTLTAQ